MKNQKGKGTVSRIRHTSGTSRTRRRFPPKSLAQDRVRGVVSKREEINNPKVKSNVNPFFPEQTFWWWDKVSDYEKCDKKRLKLRVRTHREYLYRQQGRPTVDPGTTVDVQLPQTFLHGRSPGVSCPRQSLRRRKSSEHLQHVSRRAFGLPGPRHEGGQRVNCPAGSQIGVVPRYGWRYSKILLYKTWYIILGPVE